MPSIIPSAEERSKQREFLENFVRSYLLSLPQRVLNVAEGAAETGIPIVSQIGKAVPEILPEAGKKYVAELATPRYSTPAGKAGTVVGEILPLPTPSAVAARVAQLGTAGKGLLSAGSSFISEYSRSKDPLRAALTSVIGGAFGTGVAKAEKKAAEARAFMESKPVTTGTSILEKEVSSVFTPPYWMLKALEKSNFKPFKNAPMAPRDMERLTKAAMETRQPMTTTGSDAIQKISSNVNTSIADAVEKMQELATKILPYKDTIIDARAIAEKRVRDLAARHGQDAAEIMEKAQSKLAQIGSDLGIKQVNAAKRGYSSFVPDHYSKVPGLNKSDWVDDAISHEMYNALKEAESRLANRIRNAAESAEVQTAPWMVDVGKKGTVFFTDATDYARDLMDLAPIFSKSISQQRTGWSSLLHGVKEGITPRAASNIALRTTAETPSSVLGIPVPTVSVEKAGRVIVPPTLRSTARTAGALVREPQVALDQQQRTEQPPVEKPAEQPLDIKIDIDQEKKTEDPLRANNIFNVQATVGDDTWNGEIKHDYTEKEIKDKAWIGARFNSPADSARAAAISVKSHYDKGHRSLFAMLSKFAPKEHKPNDPVKYANYVAKKLGMSSIEEEINPSDPEFMKNLLIAMSQMEISPEKALAYEEDIKAGVDRAFADRDFAKTAPPPSPMKSDIKINLWQ